MCRRTAQLICRGRGGRMVVEDIMRYLVVAGGPVEDLPENVAALGTFDMVVCADGGAHNARLLGLTPALVVGDLDSLDEAEHARLQALGCRFLVHPAAKDETDLELALEWCLHNGAHDITVIGAFGGRPDHWLGNVMLLSDARLRTCSVVMQSRSWTMWLARGETTIQGRGGDIVSLVPLSERVTGIVTDGLLYPLANETLRRGPALGISNVMLGEQARVKFRRGLLIVLHGPPV